MLGFVVQTSNAVEVLNSQVYGGSQSSERVCEVSLMAVGDPCRDQQLQGPEMFSTTIVFPYQKRYASVSSINVAEMF
jgi:hypothetical protein